VQVRREAVGHLQAANERQTMRPSGLARWTLSQVAFFPEHRLEELLFFRGEQAVVRVTHPRGTPERLSSQPC
jgi:hypothetical protein